MSDLRNKLIRLAHENPELRKDLLPLLKEAAEIRIMDLATGSTIEVDANEMLYTTDVTNGRIKLIELKAKDMVGYLKKTRQGPPFAAYTDKIDAMRDTKESLRRHEERMAHAKLPLLKEGGTEPDLSGEMKSLTEYLAKSLRKFNPGYIDFGHIGMTDGYMFHLDIPFNDHQKSIKLFLGLLKKQVKDIRKSADYSDNYETSIVFESKNLPKGGARTVPLKIQIIMEKEPDRRMEINVYK